MPVPFKTLRLDHVVLRARDPAKLEAFYVDVLGCPVEKRHAHARLTQLRAGDALIDIVPASVDDTTRQPADGGNMDHLCLRIDPFEPDRIIEWLAEHGIKGEPPGLRYGAEGEGPSIYLDDPEGNRIELKGPPSR